MIFEVLTHAGVTILVTALVVLVMRARHRRELAVLGSQLEQLVEAARRTGVEQTISVLNRKGRRTLAKRVREKHISR